MEVFRPLDRPGMDSSLDLASSAAGAWSQTAILERATVLRQVAHVLRGRSTVLARMITQEMGKLLRESLLEVERCAVVCEYYADHGPGLLADVPVRSSDLDWRVIHQPLGVILAVMPWNFPFWQVFRCAAPTLLAGNAMLLKHASNVPRCALAIEEIFRDAGAPEGLFQTLLVSADQVADLVRDHRVQGVTLTGSEQAGRSVAAVAGQALKPVVLELGGSDPFIVLDDADLDLTVAQALTGRFQNAGQSCIAAKRFILLPGIADAFLERFIQAVAALRSGDPMLTDTSLAPMARVDLRDALHVQVKASIAAAAVALHGCALPSGSGAFYPASILDHVIPGMPAYEEEIFGPVACMLRARDEEHALHMANDTRFGLGGSVWSRDRARAEALARRLACGSAFVNGIVRSDPRLPFGGIRDSGHGRELSVQGLMAFCNIKSLVSC